MKKQAFTAAFISALLITALAGAMLNSANANPYYYVRMPSIDYSINLNPPENNKAYSPNYFVISFVVNVTDLGVATGLVSASFTYTLDEQKPVLFPKTSIDSLRIQSYSFNKPLFGLTEGVHHLTITGHIRVKDMHHKTFLESTVDSNTVTFYIGDSPPQISILAPENASFTSSDIEVSFRVNRLVKKLGYSLDGQENLIISGNTTLTGLPYGDHNITVYAIDESGNIGSSETIYFRVEEPFPTLLVVASTTSMAIVGVGLLVYFRKRKQ